MLLLFQLQHWIYEHRVAYGFITHALFGLSVLAISHFGEARIPWFRETKDDH